MARYAPTEEQYQCDMCTALPTLREMTVRIMKTVSKDINYHCPGCNAHLLVTNKHGLFMRVYRFRTNRLEVTAAKSDDNSVAYIRTDGIDEPVEIEGL